MRTILLVIGLALTLGSCDAEPATTTPGPQQATFTAADGTTLTGRVYGTGTTAVVLSNMGDNDPALWDDFAPALAAKGFTVLTYGYRYSVRAQAFTAEMAKGTVADLEGAIAFVRQQHGATRVVLIGASLGGMAASKVAGRAGAAAVVLMASRLDLRDYDFRVTEAELAALTMRKLVITSDADSTTAPALTREVYDRAPEPKSFHTYPGTAHGVRLFATQHGPDLRQRLIDFVAAG